MGNFNSNAALQRTAAHYWLGDYIDKQVHITQKDLITRFPIHCRQRSKDQEGCASILDFYYMVFHLKLARSFKVGLDKDFVEANKASIPDGIFLQTTNYHDGRYDNFHMWRLADTQTDHFVVINSDKYSPEICTPYPWDYLEKRGCSIHVCQNSI